MRVIPQLIVRKEAIDAMAEEAHAWPEIETGWTSFGFILPDQSIYLAGIIPPLEGEIDRKLTDATVGGKRTGAASDWLKKDAKLLGLSPEIQYAHLSTGHSHHQMGMFEYSGIDHNTLREKIEGDLEVVVGVLSVLRPLQQSRKRKKRPTKIYRVLESYEVWFKFYCFTQAMLEAGERYAKEVPAKQITEVDDLSDIPIPRLGWQFATKKKYERQIRLLQKYGCTVRVSETKPPVVRFMIERSKWKGGFVTIVTSWNFPQNPPSVEVVTYDDDDNSVHTDASHLWKPELSFLHLIRTIEKDVFWNGTT